jgi:hypothetical protein
MSDTGTLFPLQAVPTHGCAGPYCQLCDLHGVAADERPGRYRSTDPATSAQGAADVAVRAGGQKARLLAAYAAHPGGLLDEEAAAHAGLQHTGFWKRCSELLADGLIADTGRTRVTSQGSPGRVCIATAAGHAAHGGAQ